MRLLGNALTFDDVLLVPAYSQVLPKDTSLATPFTRRITLNLPLVSAAMDTVTEARLAIAIAQEGGIGIIHKNLSAQEQAAHVAKVKRYESGVLRDPVVISPGTTVREVMQLSDELGVSGFPVVDKGLVQKVASPLDGRSVFLVLTPRGRTLWRKVMVLVERRNRALTSCLSEDEYRQLLDMFERMLAQAKAAHRPEKA